MSNEGTLGFPRGGDLPAGLLGFPLGLADLGPPRHATYNQEPGQTYFNDLVAPAGANTKNPTWETLTPASGIEFDADGIYISGNSGSTQSSFLMDLAWGPPGAADSSLKLLVENLCMCGNGGAGGGTNIHPMGWTFIPGRIPAGSRIAGRVQCSTGSQGFRVPLIVAGGGFYRMISAYLPDGECTHVGANLAASRGTQVDPGGSAGTKGAWVELGRAEKRMRAMVVSVSQENAAPSSAYFRLDVAKNSGREIILPDYAIGASLGTSNSGEGVQGEVLTPLLFTDVEAGETLAARLQCSITDATDRILHVMAVGFS